MKKIPFEDLPSTDTPIDSDNLNLMQDNMEDAIIPIKLVDISDSAPSSATTGDMYYNTTDNKVYTATATNTWDSGSTPRYDGFYVNTNDNTLFYYNGSTLIGVGGSQSGVNIKNEYTTSDTDAYSCNYINNLENQISYSLTEQKTNEIWIDGKPIYRKTMYISSLPNDADVTYNHNIQNADTIWFDMTATFIWVDGNCNPLPFIHGEFTQSNNGASSMSIMSLTNTSFHIITGTNRSSWGAYVTLKYTKTTD